MKILTKDGLKAYHAKIKELLNGKSNTDHTHDETYYTKEEVNNLMNTCQISGILKAGVSTITLTHEKITSESMIDIYTSIYGVNPKTVDITDGSITLTFKEQSNDIQIKVVIS